MRTLSHVTTGTEAKSELHHVDARRLSLRTAGSITLALAAMQLPVWLSARSVRATALLWPLAERANPYFIPDAFWQLYVWTPLVIFSAFAAVLTPGLLAALATGFAKSLESWILYGFAISLIGLSVATGVAQQFAGRPIGGVGFLLITMACSILSLLLLMAKMRQTALPWPKRFGLSSLPLLIGVPFGLLATLAPKFYWENFNGDGVHAFESTRLLLHQPLPFWPSSAGDIAAFPGITSMLFAFPNSWFIRLFGEYEIAVRAPFLLYLIALFCAIVLVAESGRAAVRNADKALIWGALAVYSIVIAYSATYNPYSADIALPATQDTLLMVCFIGFVHAFLENRSRWLAAFGLLAFWSLPNGLLLMGFWLAAVAVTWRPLPWRRLLALVALLAACAALVVIAPRALRVLGLPTPGSEYGAAGLREYFAELDVTDWRRFLFAIVPGGVVPPIALFAWRSQDQVARAVTLVAVATFCFFYVQATTALHYYIPVMLLPLLVFWRCDRIGPLTSRGSLRVAAGAGLLVALVLSVPDSWVLDSHARRVGQAISFADGRYHAMDPIAFRRTRALRFLFPYDWNPAVPYRSYGGSPLVWNYYAHAANKPHGGTNYIVQDTTGGPVSPGRLVGATGKWGVFVVSDSIWDRHRAPRQTTPPGSRLYAIPRSEMFR